MNVDELIAKAAELSPEDKAKLAAACGTVAPAVPPPDATMADAGKAKTDGDEMPPGMKAFAEKCDKMFADLTGRLGAMEADKTAQMSAAAEEKEKAFSAAFDREVVRLGVNVRATPHAIGKVKKAALADIPKEFSAGADPVAAFGDLLAPFAALPVNPLLRDAVADAAAPGPLDDRGRAVLDLTPLGRAVARQLTPAG